MLTIYLICLIVGGVLVGISALSGFKDTDAGGKEIDSDTSWGFEKPELHSPQVFGDAALAGPKRELAPLDPTSKTTTKHWLPFKSLRFWTFGACFFGLTGVALTEYSQWSQALILSISILIGFSTGTLTAWMVHHLRKPLGYVMTKEGWVGAIGELLHPLEPRGISKIRIHQSNVPPRELLAVLSTSCKAGLPRNTRVVVLEFKEGKAVIQPADSSMLMPELQAATAYISHEEHS